MKIKERKTTDAYGVSLDKNKFASAPKAPRKTAYERYFEGYTQQRVDSPDGSSHKFRRVYTGVTYRQELGRSARIRLRIAHGALFLASAALLISATVLRVASNYQGYVLLSFIVACFFYARQFLALFTYLPSGQELRIFEYRDGAEKLPHRSNMAALSAFLPMIAAGVMFLLKPDSFQQMELVRLAMLALSAACIYASGRLEARVKYTMIPGIPEAKTEAKEE